MKVLAIDPAMTLGLAVAENGKVLFHDTFTAGTPDQSVHDRCKAIREYLTGKFAEHQPDMVVMEEQNTAFDRKRGGRTINRKSLQLYSSAWTTIDMFVSAWGQPTEYVKAGPRKLPKKLAQLTARNILGVRRISTHAAEAVLWAVEYSARAGRSYYMATINVKV